MKPDLITPPLPKPAAPQQTRHATKGTPWASAFLAAVGILAVFFALDAQKPRSAKSIEGPLQQPTSPTLPSAELHVPESPTQEISAVPPLPKPEATAATAPTTQPTISSPAPVPTSSTSTSLDQESALVLLSPEAEREIHISRDQTLLKRSINEQAWSAYSSLLQKSLQSAIQSAPKDQGINQRDAIWANPALYQALLRWKTLNWLTEYAINQNVTDLYSGGALHWLLLNSPAMEEFLLTVRPCDDRSKVLKFLMDAWSIEEKRFERYFPLALACAVVFDREISIPNPIGKDTYSQQEHVINPLKRFSWFVEKNEGGKLVQPVHRSSARDLVWVVCAPVSISELEWALSHLSYRQKNWGDAYGKVEYLMERATDGLNPYKEYSFAEILKEGGICSDRSYFCVNTARANGIPAMTISGETDSGGHAWAGIKIDSDEWTTDIGRIGGASKGMADDPQSGNAITEQEIQLWSDRHHTSPTHTLAVHRHLWLADFFRASNNPTAEAEAIRLAHKLGKSFVEAWTALFDILKRETQLTGNPPKPTNLEEWKDFASSMRREFKENPRMAAIADQAEMDFIFPYLPASDANRQLTRERRRVERNSGEQADLMAESVKRQATLALQKGDSESKKEVTRLYDRALRDYGASITAFRMMAKDYFSVVRHDPDLAAKAVRDIELAFKRVMETGSTDFFRAGAEADIARMISGFYREIGQEDRAKSIEKRHEILTRRAKRSAD